MVASKQSLPGDARHAFFQPDWNSSHGWGVTVPDNRNVSRDLGDLYESQRAGQRIRYGTEAQDPVIASVTPDNGPAAGGTRVTITGSNFHGATWVTFGGTGGLDFVVESPTRIMVTTPAKPALAYDVIVTSPAGTGTVDDGFTYYSGDSGG